MKKIAAILLLISGISIVGLAQSGRRERRTETAPSPTPTPTFEDPTSVSDSVPRSIRSAPDERPTLRRGGSSTAPKPSEQTSQPSAVPAGGEVISDETEVLRVETSVVTIPVTVIDRQGRFVPDLAEQNFKIFEDGKEQKIAYFNTTEQPFTVVLLLDVSNSTQFKIDKIQEAAISFVQQLKENDRVMIIAFDENVRPLTRKGPTSNRQELISAIRRANFGGGTSLYDAVDIAINRELKKIQGRKAIVLFSDGVDTTSHRSSYDRTVRDSEELDGTIYTIYYNTFRDMRSGGGGTIGNPYPQRGGIGGILGTILGGGNVQIGGGGGSGTSREEYLRGEQYLEDLAAKTGGRKYDANTTSNLETAFYNIAEELRRQYSLGYYPSEAGQNGQRKQVKVRVDRPNLIVRARDSYVVSDNAQNAKQNLVNGAIVK